MMEALTSTETSALRRATLRNFPVDAILQLEADILSKKLC
jgi:hypothetical protein